MKRELEQIEIPAEHAARERAWTVASVAFAERQPVRARSLGWRPLVAAAAALAVLAAVASQPGRAVLGSIRDVVGVERAQPALFSLPTAGRLLVASDAGVWVVQQDGSKRLLGDYREASWSPFGRFVVAARQNELAALEPDGDIRWTLGRPDVQSPRWTGIEADTRIAYLSRSQPRVVAGDGTGDQPICAISAHRESPLAWRPGRGFSVAIGEPSGIVQVVDVDRCVQRWTAGTAQSTHPRAIEWSSDATALLVTSKGELRLYRSGTGRTLRTFRGAVAGAFQPNGRELAAVRRRGGLSELVVDGRILFRGSGEFRHVAWSPDGKWILVGWPTADQWVFVRADGSRIRAVANVSEQFRSRSFPRIEGWCCGD